MLEQGFDFTVEEEYRFDRLEMPWPASNEELDEVWRQRVKNDWLLLKLADQDDEEIAETLTERLHQSGSTHQRVQQRRCVPVFS